MLCQPLHAAPQARNLLHSHSLFWDVCCRRATSCINTDRSGLPPWAALLQASRKTLVCVLQVLRGKITHEQMQAMPAVTSLAAMRQRQHVAFAQPRFEMGWAAAEVRHLHRFLRFSASDEDVMWASTGECGRCQVAGQSYNARCLLHKTGCFLHGRDHHGAAQPLGRGHARC